MIIDKQQLISLLEEKTGLQREQVEDQLSELVSRIQEAAEEGKTFEIEGFGTFSMEEGNLQFEPTETLQTEINNKYAGMKPIELIGAFKEPEGDEIPDIDESQESLQDKAWAFDKEASVSSDEEGDQDEEEREEPIAEADDIVQEQAPPVEEDTEETFEEVFDTIGESSEPSEEPEQKEAEAEMEPESESFELEKVQDEEAGQEDPIGKFLVAAVVVIAVLTGGWLVYDTGIIGGNTGNTDAQEASAGASTERTSQVAASEDSMENENPKQTAQETTMTASTNSQGSEPQQQNQVGNSDQQTDEISTSDERTSYGLTGEVNPSINNGYTLVVHSLRDLGKAENRKQNLKQAGFRVVISKANVDGTTYYRVGLGQFESIEAAQQASENLPEQFRDSQNHFIKRIQQLISN